MIKRTVRLLEKLGSQCRPFVGLYSAYYRQVVSNEIALADITAADTVLNIGCGAIPFTAILIARLAGASVVAVDRDPRAVALARGCVKKLGLDHLIRVVHGDGAEQLPVAFDVAVVALQAEPRAQILSRLMQAQGTRRGRRIVTRVPSGTFRQQYDPMPSQYPVAAHVPQGMKTFDRSVLMVA